MTRNVRYDETIHASYHGSIVPLCGSALIPAMRPERTNDEITCAECLAILGLAGDHLNGGGHDGE